MRLGLGLDICAGGSPAFTPNVVSGIFTWLRADVGYSAGTWTDQSSGGHNFAQATGTKQPTLTTLGGQVALQFASATARTLTSAVSSYPSAAEAFIVGQLNIDPPIDFNRAGLWGFGSAATASYVPFTDGDIYDAWGSTTRPAAGHSSGTMASPFVYSVRSSASAWSNHLNGTQLATRANTVGWAATAELGSSVGGSNYLDGKIAEFIMFDHVLTAGDRSLVLAYLAARYGITVA
jgi:hypothetical protein